MSTQIGKVAYFRINAQNYRCKHDAQFSLGGVEGEPMAADGKAYVGASFEPIASTFEGTLLEANDLDMVELTDMQAFDVDVILDTGQIYRIGDAYWSTPPTYQGGEVSISGFGKKAKKVI